MRNIIITGANGNLGSAVTSLLLDLGYQVTAVIAPSAKDSFIQHEQLDVQVVDLTNEYEADLFVAATIEKRGQVHAALMLVGGFVAGTIDQTAGKDISQQLSLNFNTAYFTARPLYRHMKLHGEGRLVFIGARPAIEAASGKDLVAYSLSKSLLFKLAEYINEESKGTNVTATVVAPSTLDTPLNRQSMPDTDPSGWVKPQDLAVILEFIVSAKGSAMREAVIKVYNNS